MSRNYIISILVAFYLFAVGVTHAKELNIISDDELIIRGLFFEEYKLYKKSREIFAKLYDNTGTKEYLFKEATASLMSGSYIEHSLSRVKLWDKKHPNTLEAKRLLVPLLMTNKQMEEAKIEAEYLMDMSTEAKDLDLASNPYLYLGEFDKALELLDMAYKKSSNEDVLLRMSIIMDEYTNERKKAIQLLEMHSRMNIVVSNELYFKLLKLYINDNNVDGVIRVYKTLYSNDKKEKYLQKIIEAYAYKGDLDGAILFLEENQVSDKILYELYKRGKYLNKALKLLVKIYKEDNDPIWLAEKAILTFEKAENKDDLKMLQNVIGYFDKAISQGVDDSIYLNYYGYTLIDKEVDIKKGMKIILDALIQQPDNTYYLDSLAWGYYKVDACDKAHKMMKRVVDMEGLEEPEIAEHWRAIQSCK